MMRIENPFTLKAGEVFAGFGIGCGFGIGVGRPLNIGAKPVLNQVRSATRGATDAFSGLVRRHVNLKKLGGRNIESGFGCGVGFGHDFGVGIGCGVGSGHGFGLGLSVKLGMAQQIQSRLLVASTKVMNFGTNFSVGRHLLPSSLLSGASLKNEPSNQNLKGSLTQLSTSKTSASMIPPLNASYGSGTKKVISSSLQSPIPRDEDNKLTELDGKLGSEKSENNILQMVLKHQQVIEELMEENEKLRHILVEDLKISPSKLQTSNSSKKEDLKISPSKLQTSDSSKKEDLKISPSKLQTSDSSKKEDLQISPSKLQTSDSSKKEDLEISPSKLQTSDASKKEDIKISPSKRQTSDK